ncbi:MAG: hypothetical protein NC543_09865 [bacterium]|nr:hypothetical protein [bacterium]MCM1376175.1 hypothetical protein [Muribaculum sp.]
MSLPSGFSGDWDDFERCDVYGDSRPYPSKEVLGIFMEDAMNREAGKVAPDTAGADYFFLKGFVNEPMEDDFALIEKDFLLHCSDKMAEYYNAAWYGGDMAYDSSPEEIVRRKLLVMIFNGAKLGDSYCRKLIKYLYKTYYKREYNQLKRFKTIDVQEVFSLTEDEEDGSCRYEDMGRIIGMCGFMDIRLSDECSLLYTMFNKQRDQWEAEDQEQLEWEGFQDGLLEECIQTVDAWRDAEEENKKKCIPHRKYWTDEEFACVCFRYFGYSGGYAYKCRNVYAGLRMDMARTLALLKTVYPEKEFGYEEVQSYAHIYALVDALTQAVTCFDEQIGRLMGVDDYLEEDEEKTLFKPENIDVSEKKEQRREEKPAPVNVAPVSMGEAEAEDYLAEIALLRKKLHEKEQENQYLREVNRNAKNAEKDAQALINQLKGDREELIALREYAYQSASEPEPIAEVKLEEMQAAIAGKAVVIIGGHVNWLQKLRRLFPEWLFIHPSTYRTVDGKVLENRERVYFFTDYLNHVSYVKFIAALREKRIPFGYLGSVNVENVVRRVYEDLVMGKG